MSDKSHQFSQATREGFVMKSYKYKLKPSAKIISIFEAWLAICCQLYNAALQERRDAYRIVGKSVGFAEKCAELPEVKAERPDVARVHSQVLQNVLRRVALAFDDFFRRMKKGQNPGYPRFRSRLRYSSFTFPQAKGTFLLEGDRLHLSKIGKVKVHLSRPITGAIKTCTIKREADGLYVIFAVEEPDVRGRSVPNPRVEFGDGTADCVGSGSGFERVSDREAFRELVVSEPEPASVRREGVIEPYKSEQQSSGGCVSSSGGECGAKPERVGSLLSAIALAERPGLGGDSDSAQDRAVVLRPGEKRKGVRRAGRASVRRTRARTDRRESQETSQGLWA